MVEANCCSRMYLEVIVIAPAYDLSLEDISIQGLDRYIVEIGGTHHVVK